MSTERTVSTASSQGVDTFSPSARHKARVFAVQALYQAQLSGGSPADIEAQFLTDNDVSKTDVSYFHELLHQVLKQQAVLDEHYQPLLDRELQDLDPVSRAVLRMATYELVHRIDVPYRVVINESVSLAKKFGPTDSFKYVNSILDAVAKQLRKVEQTAG